MNSVARTYLDFNATTPLRPEAHVALSDALDVFGNPSSIHAEGRKARGRIEASRMQVTRLMGASPKGLVFTSSATEALNMVIGAKRVINHGHPQPIWDAIIVAVCEHAAVLEPARRSGVPVLELTVQADGLVDQSHLAALLEEAVAIGPRVLVCLQAANNETGVLQPIDAVVRTCRSAGAHVLCDAVQAVGKVAFDAAGLDLDYVVVSAHKLGGPKGVGALWVGPGRHVPSLIAGGGQELGARGGTENVLGIIAFGAAAESASKDLESRVPPGHISGRLKSELESRIKASLPGAVVVAEDVPRLPNTTLVMLPGKAAETVVIGLDLAGFAVSSGAACSSGKVSRSHVLAAMGFDDELNAGAIRISTGWTTSLDEIAGLVDALASLGQQKTPMEQVA